MTNLSCGASTSLSGVTRPEPKLELYSFTSAVLGVTTKATALKGIVMLSVSQYGSHGASPSFPLPIGKMIAGVLIVQSDDVVSRTFARTSSPELSLNSFTSLIMNISPTSI